MESLADRINKGRRAIELAQRYKLGTEHWESHLNRLVKATRNQAPGYDSRPCWVLEEWERTDRPIWQNILCKATDIGDQIIEDRARWMLEVMEHDVSAY